MAPKPPLPSPLGKLLEPLYLGAVARRNRRFDHGNRVAHAPIPVISIGNLSVGGAGKTPMVMTIVRWLRDAGHNPGIAMRGYARRGGISDEQAEYQQRLPQTPVAADPVRRRGIAKLHSECAIDCALLDDGFQHRFVARQLDIVLLDLTRDVFAERCLPAGWLREPAESLRRADAIVLTHAERCSGDEIEHACQRVRQITGSALICVTRHGWSGLIVGEYLVDVDWLNGKRIVLACGIGNPAPLAAQLEQVGAQVVRQELRRDHHHWQAIEARRLFDAIRRGPADAIVTTGKDWPKLAPLLRPDQREQVVRPLLDIEFDAGGGELRRQALAVCHAQRPR